MLLVASPHPGDVSMMFAYDATSPQPGARSLQSGYGSIMSHQKNADGKVLPSISLFARISAILWLVLDD